jgi:5-methylcytosine-specific restriction endonuclease McrA
MIGPKRPRLRLDPDAYDRLRQLVLKRDGWRCQYCGRASGLEVHHIRSRSRLGDDAESNLIALCVTCHKAAHSGPAGKRRVNSFTPKKGHD